MCSNVLLSITISYLYFKFSGIGVFKIVDYFCILIIRCIYGINNSRPKIIFQKLSDVYFMFILSNDRNRGFTSITPSIFLKLFN
jgi:hypothetical protein